MYTPKHLREGDSEFSIVVGARYNLQTSIKQYGEGIKTSSSEEAQAVCEDTVCISTALVIILQSGYRLC